MRRIRRPGGGLALPLALCLSAHALSQDFKSIAPKPVPPQESAPVAPPSVPAPEAQPPAAPPAKGDAVLVRELKGLVFLSAPDQVVPKGLDQPGIDVTRVPFLAAPEFADTLRPFLGQSLTLGRLDALKRAVVEYYRGRNHPLVDVAIPVQNIATGTVQVIAREFRVGAIVAQGNQWFSDALILGEIPFKPGDTVDGSRLSDALDALNSNPFRQVAVSYRPGTEPGTTDLVVTTEDRLPFRAHAGYQNNGTITTGRDRWNLGVDWGNFLWLGQQISYQFTSSDDFWHNREKQGGVERQPSFVGHSLTYSAPLGGGQTLSIFGSYDTQVPRLGPDLGMVGISGQASLRYQAPLPNPSWFTHQIQVGYDFKTTNNNLSFGGVTVSSGTTEIDQFPIDYTMTIPDGWGGTLLDDTLVLSPGKLTAGNKTSAFEPSLSHSGTADAKARYIYDRFAVTRTFKLPWDFSAVTRASYQISDHNLLPSEQVSAGGSATVRGYEESAVTGTVGGLVTQEFHAPTFSPYHLLGGGDGHDMAEILAFWDYGSVRQKNTVAGDATSAQLASVGTGLRYHLGRYLDVSLDYAWQLRKAPGATEHGQFGHLSVTAGF